MFCFCLCKKLKSFCLLEGFPQSSKTSNQLPQSHLLGGEGTGEGQVWGGGATLKVVHLPQTRVFVEEEGGEGRSSAKMMQDTGSLFYCLGGVFYSSESSVFFESFPTLD